MSDLERTYEDDYEHPIKAIRKEFGFEVLVRKMNKDEMPDDGKTYYADTECTIYEESELELKAINKLTKE